MRNVPFRPLLSLLPPLMLSACVLSGKPGPEGRPVPAGSSEARLLLKPAALARGQAAPRSDAAPAPFDSVSVRVTAGDMEPRTFAFAGDSQAVILAGLPPGPARTVEAALFRGGRLLYLGRAVCDFRREQRLELALRCEPQFSRVLARFHLPANLPVRVAGGSLRLTGLSGAWTAPLSVRGEWGSFLLDELPGNVRYDLSLELKDSAGQALYLSERSGVHLPLGEEAHWDLPLLPARAEAGLSLELARPAEMDLEPGFPSRRRRVSAAGDAVLTELLAAPAAADSGSEGEWWELFNRTSDTLALSGCRLSRDRLGGVTRSFAFDSAHVLPPGRARVFGRRASRADYRYEDFSLVNTAASLLLLCAGDSLLVDSLRYSSAAADSGSALPMREGKALSLDGGFLGSRSDAAGWCQTAPDPARNGEAGYASPGGLAACPQSLAGSAVPWATPFLK